MIFEHKYERKMLIEKRTFSTIYKVLNNKNNKFYALKFIKTTNKKFKEKEIAIMRNIKNKYIIEIEDYFYDELNEGYCIVMELCDGNLKDFLNKKKPKGLPLNMINKIFSQLNEALKVLICNNYTHGNLKPENILIKYTDSEKINFDIKLILQSNEKKFSFFNNSINYESQQINNNNKSDLWSLGVLLYELYTNKNIFYSENEKEREDKRIKGIINETDNKIINKLIRKLTQVDINKKIKWEEYFDDEFFKNNNIIKVNNKQVKITKLKIPLLQIIFSFITEI